MRVGMVGSERIGEHAPNSLPGEVRVQGSWRAAWRESALALTSSVYSESSTQRCLPTWVAPAGLGFRRYERFQR